MRITSIDLFKADIPLKEPFRIAVMEMLAAQSVFLRINTDQEISGWGEASSFWKLCGETQAIDLAAGLDFARLIKDKDPFAIEDRMAEIEGYLKNNTQIKAAFDMALYDILGKKAGLPVYRLLGGAGRPMRTCLTLGIGPAQSMAEKAAAAVQRGFTIIKIKLGTTMKEDVERVRAIRHAVAKEVTIRIDANQGWDVPTAVSVLNRVEELDVEYCEQPVAYWNVAGLKAIHDKVAVPIVADEGVFDHHDAFRIMADDAADYVNLKLSKSGGIRTGIKVANVVNAAGKLCMIGCMMESRLGLTAAAHLASSMSHFKFFDLDSAHLLAEDPIIGGMRYENDLCVLDDKPGLGVEVDPAFLRKCQRQTI